MTERQGVEIDYCPKCRGIWLDRGELDKIIEASASPSSRYREDHRSRRCDSDDYHSRGQHHGKKKDSFLKNLFDF